ncbi:MAG: glycosyltransferase family 4 protein [Nodosilinea sp.]
MDLLYTLTSYPPAVGGAQLLSHQLIQQVQQHHGVTVACHWQRNRHDWLLGTTLGQPPAQRSWVEGVPVQQLGLTAWQKLALVPAVALYYPLMPLALPRIAGAIARPLAPLAAQADLIHNIRIGREGLTAASLALARRYDRPFVFTPLHHPRWVGWRYRAYHQIYRQADAVIALTPAEQETLINLGVRADRIHVTGVGPLLAPQADPQGFRRQHRIDGPMVLFLGQHYPYKGYRQVLAATRQVWRQHPDTHFVFMGPAVGRSETAFRDCADPRLHRLGMVSLGVKTAALAACDLLCVPSTQESFGGVYTEAWSFGKPVIGCPIPAVKAVITDGQEGYLVEQEATAIADRINHLLHHPDQGARLGQAGYAKVQQRYSWPQLARQTLAVYHQLVQCP